MRNLATGPLAKLLTRDGHAGTCYWSISVEAAVTRFWALQ